MIVLCVDDTNSNCHLVKGNTYLVVDHACDDYADYILAGVPYSYKKSRFIVEGDPMTTFITKDSGKRQEFASGMVRDTEEGKTDYTAVLDGPMLDRWAELLTRAKAKYPDIAPGVANWTLAEGEAELARFRKSAFRHFRQWLRGDVDEDHAAGVYFNINGAEYVKGKLNEKK